MITLGECKIMVLHCHENSRGIKTSLRDDAYDAMNFWQWGNILSIISASLFIRSLIFWMKLACEK